MRFMMEEFCFSSIRTNTVLLLVQYHTIHIHTITITIVGRRSNVVLLIEPIVLADSDLDLDWELSVTVTHPAPAVLEWLRHNNKQ